MPKVYKEIIIDINDVPLIVKFENRLVATVHSTLVARYLYRIKDGN